MEGSPTDGCVTVDSKTCLHAGEVTASDGHPSCLSTVHLIQVEEKRAFVLKESTFRDTHRQTRHAQFIGVCRRSQLVSIDTCRPR